MTHNTHTVIVGAGAAGVPLAARLGADPSRRITLLEAGPTTHIPADLLDGSAIRGAVPGYRDNWVYGSELTRGREMTIARGRVLGGSTTINGGYFVRAPRADFRRWAEAGGPHWQPDAALEVLRDLEHDLDRGADPVHGANGPMPVTRPPQTGPVCAAFIAAARELGFPAEHDKNAQGSPGVGAVPSNTVDGTRVNTGLAYRDQLEASTRVTVRGGVRVLRVVTEQGRAVGVEIASAPGGTPEFVAADEVVLAAGAISTPQLLLLSGIGPGEQLQSLGIEVVRDLPVGSAFSDHPNLALSWRTRPEIIDLDAPFAFPTALNFDAAARDPGLTPRPEGDLEILLAAKPLETLLTGGPAGDVLQFLIALQEHSGRGRLTLRSADPFEPPRIEYRYLEAAEDRRRLRVGVRTAVELLRSPAFEGVFAGLSDLTDRELSDDDALDAWILDHLGTALHTCGTAPMGEVVDGSGRVHGVEGLRVADTSILPTTPHRGPSNTAVFIGEFIARRMFAGD